MAGMAEGGQRHGRLAFVVAGPTLAAFLQRTAGTLVLPRANIKAENADFYVTRDDIVMFPISYSIPKELVVPRVPNKTGFAVNDSMRSFQYKNYQFGPFEEEAYHQNLQRHRFADTRRKGGYDCLRHYEILANGAVPVFHDVEFLPPSILTTLPRDLLWQARELFELPWLDTEDGPGHCPSVAPIAYDTLASQLLGYTARHLTTEVTARYILDTLDIPLEGSKVLFLPCVAFDNFPSYLTASVFHGLVSLLGDAVLDVPEYHYAYQFDREEDRTQEANVRTNLWGQGYTLGFRLPRRPHLNRENISERIQAREFDLIIFGRMSPYEPCNFWYPFGDSQNSVPQYFTDVFGRYPRERVALLFGDDSGINDAVVRTHISRMAALHRGIGTAFMREMLPFPAEGPPSEVLRPVDSRTLQSGCFYGEWRDFLERWLRPNGSLRDCAAWGQCSMPEVEEYLESPEFELQQPPADPAVLKHFCSSGYMLKGALLVQRLGPTMCEEDAMCAETCDFGMLSYSRGLLLMPPEVFHEEFGVTPAEVSYVLSQGCRDAAVAIQPAMAEMWQGVAIVIEGSVLGPGAGPYSSRWQVHYLLRQGFWLIMVGGSSDEALEPFGRFLASGRLRVEQPSKDACAWTALLAQPLHYAHIELPRTGIGVVVAAIHCASQSRPEGPPPFLSLQLPVGAAEAAAYAREVVHYLLAVGYVHFKVQRLEPGSLGGPFGALAADASRGPRWRAADEVLQPDGVTSGGQLHAALENALARG